MARVTKTHGEGTSRLRRCHVGSMEIVLDKQYVFFTFNFRTATRQQFEDVGWKHWPIFDGSQSDRLRYQSGQVHFQVHSQASASVCRCSLLLRRFQPKIHEAKRHVALDPALDPCL